MGISRQIRPKHHNYVCGLAPNGVKHLFDYVLDFDTAFTVFQVCNGKQFERDKIRFSETRTITCKRCAKVGGAA